MNKKLAAIAGILLILCSATAWAQWSTPQMNEVSQMQSGASAISTYVKSSPDLTVTSAKVTSKPFMIGPNVLVPLQITIKNVGSAGVTEDFFVSAVGGDTDNRVQGYWLGGSGETVEQDSIVINGLAAGAQKTINCYLMLLPVGSQPSQPSGKYWVDVEVDGTSDPDFSGNIDESNENNNILEISYPLNAPASGGRILAPSIIPS